MDGIKTAIVGFLLVCLILPHIIKNRNQYYAALALFLVGLFFNVLAQLFSSPTAFAADRGMYVPSFWRLCHVIEGLINIVVILVLVMASGGLSVSELAGNFARSYEVIRRGEEEKEIIIPLSNQPAGGYRSRREEDDAPKRYVIEDTLPGSDAPPPPPPPPSASEKGKDDDKGIPLA